MSTSKRMKALKTHAERIQRILFFAKKHQELNKFRDGLASSIWIDTQDEGDAIFLQTINNVCMYLERKFIEEK